VKLHVPGVALRFSPTAKVPLICGRAIFVGACACETPALEKNSSAARNHIKNFFELTGTLSPETLRIAG
jgi:hypothetical protein